MPGRPSGVLEHNWWTPEVQEQDCTAQDILLTPGRPSAANTAATLVEPLHIRWALSNMATCWQAPQMSGTPTVTLVESLHATAALEHVGAPLTCQVHPQQHCGTLVDLLHARAAQEPFFWTTTCQQTGHNVTSNCKTLLLFYTVIKHAPSSIITAPACHFMGKNCVLSFILLHWVGKICLLCYCREQPHSNY